VAENFKESVLEGMGWTTGFLVAMAIAGLIGAGLTYLFATGRRG